MTRLFEVTPMPVAPERRATRRAIGCIGVLTALLLSACTVNPGPTRQPAWRPIPYDREPVRRERLPGNDPATVYTGWRLFQDRCAGCHGPAARGTSRGPDLLRVIREMDSRRFTTHVLYRYEWGIAEQRGGAEQIDALIHAVEARQRGELTLPAGYGEPRTTVHIADLFSYLSARADGSIGPERPRTLR